jgi:hypothetical protein
MRAAGGIMEIHAKQNSSMWIAVTLAVGLTMSPAVPMPQKESAALIASLPNDVSMEFVAITPGEFHDGMFAAGQAMRRG